MEMLFLKEKNQINLSVFQKNLRVRHEAQGKGARGKKKSRLQGKEILDENIL